MERFRLVNAASEASSALITVNFDIRKEKQRQISDLKRDPSDPPHVRGKQHESKTGLTKKNHCVGTGERSFVFRWRLRCRWRLEFV